ncbi:MAG: T9SS type A sorting domain-containing protein [Crocinitomicaceae bacterium]|nr:T9SS type A sorting domain-containing protein [Crocinitomicaceae bacterium]MBK8925449.1 T9SS type A sorting domain-containing protein [Crocinitomicaceae bacterium]
MNFYKSLIHALMNKIVWFVLFSISNLNLIAQWDCIYTIDFENDQDSIHITIDTISNPSNIWQIGAPQKSIFSSLPGENSIVTDTLNPYPANDTSSFIVKHVACEGIGGSGGMCSISGMYQVDTDSLNDFGKIEFSPDNGVNWVLISQDTLLYNSAPWPTFIYNCKFTGTSAGQELFEIDLGLTYEIFNITTGDTVLFKFTFISDNVSELRDGLLFDELVIFDMSAWGVNEINFAALEMYPNPSSSIVNFTNINGNIQSVRIISSDGTLVYQQESLLDNSLDIEFLKSGVYQIFIETYEGKVMVGRLMKI